MTLSTERIRMFYEHATSWVMPGAYKEKPKKEARLARVRATQAAEFDAWLAEHDAALVSGITMRVRQNCTPPGAAYTAGGDAVVAAVADWIDNPPEWVDAPWRSVVGSTPEGQTR